MRESIAGRFVGRAVSRVEDRRLLAGAGRYVDDVTVPGMLHAAFVAAPFPTPRSARSACPTHGPFPACTWS